MARDYIDIGCTPAGEPCETLGEGYNPEKAKFECRVFMNQLRRIFGEEPYGARFKIQPNNHDFGTYYEVICTYNDENEEAAEYAFKAESHMPEWWDDEAKKELATWKD